ncbi:UNVERIFIED_CONTAM: hypothetical protein Slati_3175100 [Sesamum latifolium]|uniref:Uncharacterized protein n=1 Tax=Sesamum latifolium TaxID=2727402 RepID=A0AAW2UX97_9LAMI
MEDWVVQVHETLRNMEHIYTPLEVEKWKKQSIFKLPAHVTDLDKKAYEPRVVSLGPYHHDKLHLKPMEMHKQRAFLHFMRRSEVPLEHYAKARRKRCKI